MHIGRSLIRSIVNFFDKQQAREQDWRGPGHAFKHVSGMQDDDGHGGACSGQRCAACLGAPDLRLAPLRDGIGELEMEPS